jgi:diguanylate cyclase (GGDEF)-like protein
LARDVAQLSREELVDAYRELEERVAQISRNYELQKRQIKAIGRLTTRSTQVAGLSKELNTIDLDEVVRIAVAKIPCLFSARYCSVFLYDYERNSLTLKTHNHSEDLTEDILLSRQPDTLMAIAVAADQPLLIENIEDFEKTRGRHIERLKSDKYLTNSCLISPLMVGSGEGQRRVMGVLNLADRADGESFDRDDLNVAIQLSELLGTAISTSLLVSEMRSLAETDGLTRLANHRVFREALAREIKRYERYESSFSLLMLDIDHFKKFNDRHGHLAGDQVLQQVSRTIRQTVRDDLDLPARYGGEEFAIIMPETGFDGAVAAGERLRSAVEEARTMFEGRDLNVTISVGVAQYLKARTASEFIDAADKALYQAKRGGRNRVCYWDNQSNEARAAPPAGDAAGAESN